MLRYLLPRLFPARKTLARIARCMGLLIAWYATAAHPIDTNSTEPELAAILWHPGLSLERIDTVAVTSDDRAGPEQTRIEPGTHRIYCARADYQPYAGTTAVTQMHGQAEFLAGKIYYAHQNRGRGRLEIIRLNDNFALPQKKVFLHDPDYNAAIRAAERIRQLSLFPETFQSNDEPK